MTTVHMTRRSHAALRRLQAKSAAIRSALIVSAIGIQTTPAWAIHDANASVRAGIVFA